MSIPTSPDYTLLGFSGPDRICSRCAEAAHRAAHKSAADYMAPDFDVAALCSHIFPTQPSFYAGACWACGELAPLLPAHDFGVPAPPKAAHKFAVDVLSAWLSGEFPVKRIGIVRARCEAGRHWVEFKPADSAYIHTEAARTPADAVARFIQAASY